MNAPDILSWFPSWFAMGGYGLYVWGSLGMCIAVVVAEVRALRARHRALLQELAADEAPAHALRQPVLTRQEAT
jgi:heme exporter protein D